MTIQWAKELLLDPKMHVTLTWVALAGMLWFFWHLSSTFTNIERDVADNAQKVLEDAQKIQQIESKIDMNYQSGVEVRERLVRVETKLDTTQSSINDIIADIRSLRDELKKK